MALVGFAGGVGNISGSIGDTTFSRNRFGPYIRRRAIPVNPRSARQNVVRNAVQTLAQLWASIVTSAQRAAWEVYADSIIVTNRIGAQTKLTGFNHYIRSNAVMLQAGGIRVDIGPTTLSLPPTDPTFAVVVDEATQQISVTFDNTQPWANDDNGFMNIQMSQPHGAAVNFINGPFRHAGAIVGDGTTPPTSPTVFATPFPVGELQQTVVQARVLEEDGRLSELFRDQTSVTP